MPRIFIMLVVLVLSIYSFGCGGENKYEKTISSAEKQDRDSPPANYEEAQKRFNQVAKYLDYLEKHPESSSPELTARAKALLDSRKAAAMAKGWNVAAGALEKVVQKAKEVAKEVLGTIGVTDLPSAAKKVEEARDWVLRDPEREEQFSCKDIDGNPVDVTKEGFAHLRVR
ncbi:hypothetical protein A3I84_02045 [Candidatus Nomurabacteria bacterium RIFCSPLOWO2_02_FULL_36_8]|nr:MAG: hypothetical protein A3I84_02045 [Candidatus Nomurabacteria bacterium RIFCSPLOWO2_02_FULL_36_8]